MRPVFAVGAALFLGSWLAFVANCRVVATEDTRATALLPFSIWSGDGLRLDRFVDRALEPDGYSVFLGDDGHFRNAFPIGAALVAAPLFAPLAFAHDVDPVAPDPALPLARVTEKYAAATIAAFAVLALFELLRHEAGIGRAALLAASFGLASPVWSVASQALWQHGPGALATTLALRLLLVGRPGRMAGSAAGALAALMVAIRPVDALLAAGVGLLALRRGWRRVGLPFLLTAALGTALLVAYNLSISGAATGGYQRFWGDSSYRFSLSGLGGLLVSNRGLLFFSPFLLLLFLPFRRPRMLGRFDVAALVGAWSGPLLLHAGLFGWWGGENFGARYLIDGLPVLFLLGARALEWPLSWLRAAAWAIGLTLAAAVQAIGAFAFPHGESGFAAESPTAFWGLSRSTVALARAAGPARVELRPLAALGPGRGLEETDQRARLELLGPLPAPWPAEGRHNLRVRVTNVGGSVWPTRSGLAGEFAVELLSLWRSDRGTILRGSYHGLGGPLPPKASREIAITVLAPLEEGEFVWQLVVAETQLRGPQFFSGPDAALSLPVTVEGRARTGLEGLRSALLGERPAPLLTDGFETGDATRWSRTAAGVDPARRTAGDDPVGEKLP